MALDKYMGRQMYPKDTVTRKQMDRQDDRQTRRIDLQGDKIHKLKLRIGELEAAWQRIINLLEDEEKQD